MKRVYHFRKPNQQDRIDGQTSWLCDKNDPIGVETWISLNAEEVTCPECNKLLHTAKWAMAEIWGLLCPDCGPEDYEAIVNKVRELVAAEVV